MSDSNKIENNIEQEKLNINIRLAIRHSYRILYAREKMTEFFPLTTSEYMNLSDEKKEHIDQFVYRFQKLQDDMGMKLFKSVVANLGDQKIDVILADKSQTRIIDKIVKKEGKLIES